MTKEGLGLSSPANHPVVADIIAVGKTLPFEVQKATTCLDLKEAPCPIHILKSLPGAKGSSVRYQDRESYVLI